MPVSLKGSAVSVCCVGGKVVEELEELFLVVTTPASVSLPWLDSSVP